MNERHDPRLEAAPILFIGKWTPKILNLLSERPHRHGELRRSLGAVSQRMLTRTLRNLEGSGLIARQETRSRSVAVKYSLTQLGRTFIAPMRSVCRWSNRYGRRLNAAIHL
jgi:DNA-binding HxlR family transcriptional regulator